ncbi:MAG: hypothetical protein ACR2P6_06065 [Gammaproteobacteria bacterium]
MKRLSLLAVFLFTTCTANAQTIIVNSSSNRVEMIYNLDIAGTLYHVSFTNEGGNRDTFEGDQAGAEAAADAIIAALTNGGHTHVDNQSAENKPHFNVLTDVDGRIGVGGCRNDYLTACPGTDWERFPTTSSRAWIHSARFSKPSEGALSEQVFDFRKIEFSTYNADPYELIESGTQQPANGTNVWNYSWSPSGGSATQNGYLNNTGQDPDTVLLKATGTAGPGSAPLGNIRSIYKVTFMVTSPFEGTLSGSISGGESIAVSGGAVRLSTDFGATTLFQRETADIEGDGEFSYHGFFNGIYEIEAIAYGFSDPFAYALSGAFEVQLEKVVPSTVIMLDVSPNDPDNKVYPNQSGQLPVAVLGGLTFDATQVDPATVTFGLGEATPVDPPVISQVDGQHGDDATFKFAVPQTGILCNDTDVTISGETYAGEPIQGTDTIDATECETGCHAY